MNSKFECCGESLRQQKLPCWSPDYSAKNAWKGFLIVGFIFLTIGIVTSIQSYQTFDESYNYTYCLDKNNQSQTCASYVDSLGNNFESTCQCQITITIPKDLKGKVKFYYELSNFYQNHRNYYKSVDQSQLMGKTGHTIPTEANPYIYKNDTKIAPVGAIANSLFSDSFEIYKVNTPNSLSKVDFVTDSETKITRSSDDDRYSNPTSSTCSKSDLACVFSSTTSPTYWGTIARLHINQIGHYEYHHD